MNAHPKKRLLILSDLHLRFANLDLMVEGKRLDASADILVLAGDLDETHLSLRWARHYFPDKPIVAVCGNHELYRNHWVHGIQCMRDTAKSLDIYFLENDEVVVDGVRFLGCTLWTDYDLFGREHRAAAMKEAHERLNDHRLTDISDYPSRQFFMTPADALERHQQSRAWLQEALARLPGAAAHTVVVTHHAPSGLSMAERYAKDLLSAAFASDLSDLMGQSALWVHGHMHNSSDYMLNGTRVVCNPRGYVRRYSGEVENKAFVPNLTVEVDVEAKP